MKRMISLVLAVVLLVSALPLPAFAELAQQDALIEEILAQAQTQPAPETQEAEPVPETAPVDSAADAAAAQPSAAPTEVPMQTVITVPVVESAAKQEESAGFTYTVLNGTYCQITGYTGSDAVLEIPAELDGYTVQSIAANSFTGNATITSVVLADTVESIGSNAFRGCTALGTVTPGSMLSEIGSAAFSGCTMLTSITIPAAVETLGNNAFQNCTALAEVTFSEGLLTVGSYAFADCTTLTVVELPASVTTLGYGCFQNCTALASVALPAGWTSTGLNNPNGGLSAGNVGHIFEGCTALTELALPAGMTALPDYAFTYCTSLQQVTLPDGLESIGSSAFYGCTGLTGITLNSALTTIGASAFRDCTGLASVAMNRVLSTMGSYAFYGCTGLTSIEVTGALVELPAYAFAACTGLEKVTVTVPLLRLCDSAFSGCTALQAVTLPDALTELQRCVFSGCAALTQITLPENVATLGYGCFMNCTALQAVTMPAAWNAVGLNNPNGGLNTGNVGYIFAGCTALKSVALPQGVSGVPAYGFNGCAQLEQITLPDSLNFVNDYAFANCSALQSVTLPEQVTNLGKEVFVNCTSLASVALGENLAEMGTAVFSGCAALTEINVPGSVALIPASAFANCTALQDVALNEGTTGVGASAFIGCTKLERIALPASVTALGDTVFKNCTALSDVTLPAGWKTAGGSIFSGCTALRTVTLPEGMTTLPDNALNGCSLLEDVALPSTLTSIGASAFAGCTGLTVMEMPAALTGIGNSAFANCTGLKAVTLNEGLTTLGENVFSGCTALRRIAVPGTVETVPYNTFNGCTGLVEATLAEGTLVLGENAFSGCTGLYTVTLPAGLTEIGKRAFRGCTSLQVLDLPDSVSVLGFACFDGCTDLTEMTMPLSWSRVGYDKPGYGEMNWNTGYIFNGCTGLKKVIIPEGATAIPRYGFNACTYLEEVVLPDTLETINTCAFLSCSGLKKLWIGEQVTTIGASAFDGCTNLTIHGVEGSAAESFASACSIPFSTESLDYPTAVCSGRVLDEAGNGVAGVSVAVYDLTDNELRSALTTDADGKWEGDAFRTGHSYRLRFYHKNYTIAQSTLDIAVGEAAFAAADVTAAAKPVVAETDAAQFTYTVLNGTYCQLTGYTGTDTVVSMPETLDGYIVQSIAAGAFKGNTTLTCVVLPDTVRTVENGAFSGCTALTDVRLGKGMQSASASMFNGCTSLQQIALPNSVAAVYDSAFAGCTALTQVDLPLGLTVIDGSVFAGCTALTQLTLPEGLQVIYSQAFRNCTALTELKLPDTITDLAGAAFDGCTALETINLPAGLNNIISTLNTNGAALYRYTTPFTGCTSLKTVTVPEGMTVIPAYTFRNMAGLESIALPASVKSIGERAFEGCSTLQSITFSEGLESIGAVAFGGCTALQEAALPNSLTELGASAFSGCTGLETASVGSGLTLLSGSTFEGCTALKEVTLSEGLTTIHNRAFWKCTGLEEIDLPASVTTLSTAAFEGCSALARVGWPVGLTTILSSRNSGADALAYYSTPFAGCTSLKEITIPAGVTAIPAYTFRGMTTLETITFSEGLTDIGERAFEGCTALAELALPASVTTLGGCAFTGCTALGTLTLNDGLTEMGGSAFANCTKLKMVTLPGTLTSVSAGAFSDCTGLTEIILSEGVTALETDAFAGCAGVTKVTLPETLVTIGTSAFADCTALKEILLPEGLETIGASAFSGCSKLIFTILPDTIVRVEDGAFYNCKWLQYADLANVQYLGKNVFEGCKKLTDLTIPATLTQISGSYGAGPLAGSSIRTLTVENGITGIPAYLCAGASALENVSLPENTDAAYSIGSYAFYQCAALKNINIPASVSSIGAAAFAGCTKLDNLWLSKDVVLDATALEGAKVADLVLESEDSDAILKVIDLEMPYTAQNTGIADTTARRLDRTATEYITPISTVSSGGWISLRVNYAFKESDTQITSPVMVLRIPSGATVQGDILQVNGKKVEYTNDAGWIAVPLEDLSGTVELGVRPENMDYVLSYARMVYTADGVQCKETIGIVNMEANLLTLNVPYETATSEIRISGTAKPYEAVDIYVEDILAASTVASALGSYRKTITLPDVAEGTSYTVEVRQTRADGTVASAVDYVHYSADAIQVTEFWMTNSGGRFDLIALANSSPIIQLGGGQYQFSFVVSFNNNELVDKARIKNTKNGHVTVLDLSYNRDKDQFMGTITYTDVPGVITLEYAPESTETLDVTFVGDTQWYTEGDNISGRMTPLTMTEPNVTFYYLEEVETNADLPQRSELLCERYMNNRTVYLNLEPVRLRRQGGYFICFEMYERQRDGSYRVFRQGSGLFEQLPEAVFADYGIPWEELYPEKPDMVEPDTGELIDRNYVTSCKTLPKDNEITTYTVAVANAARASDAAAEFQDFWDNAATVTKILKDRDHGKKDTDKEKEQKYAAVYEFLDGAQDGYTIFDNEWWDIEINKRKLKYSELVDRTGDAFEQTRNVIDNSNDLGQDPDEIDPDKRAEEMKELTEDMEELTDYISDETLNEVIHNIVDPDPDYDGESLWDRILKDKEDKYREYVEENRSRYVIDPSGYVYEAVESNRIPGVKVTVYYKDTETGEAVLWDASEFEQENPLYTDQVGYYSWDVPEGEWQVKYEMDGYETAYSDWLPVPPPQMDVNMGLVSTAAPQVEQLAIYQDAAELRFTQYVDVTTVTAQTVRFTMDGAAVAGAWQPLDAEAAAANPEQMLARTFRFVPESALAGAVSCTAQDVVSYNGLALAQYTASQEAQLRIIQLQAPETLSLPYSGSRTVTITALPAEAAAGKTLQIAVGADYLAAAESTAQFDANGQASFTVAGLLPGETTLTYAVEGTTWAGNIQVTLVDPESCDHTETTVVPEQAATCTEAGHSSYEYCTACDKVVGTRTVYEAQGHNYLALVVQPTEDAPGYTKHTCDRCGDSYTDSYVSWLAKGDLNGSGTVTVADALMLANSIAQKTMLTDNQQLAADLNEDGAADVLDLTALLNRITGKIA